MSTNTGPQGSKRLFHTFKQWLKNESFHRRGKYCKDDGCGTCSEWRRLEQLPKPAIPITADDVLFRAVQMGVDRFAALALEIAEEGRQEAEQEQRWNELQDVGFDYGRTIANDALAVLAASLPPESMLPRLDAGSKEQAVFVDALLQGFKTTLRCNLADNFSETAE